MLIMSIIEAFCLAILIVLLIRIRRQVIDLIEDTTTMRARMYALEGQVKANVKKAPTPLVTA